METAFPILVVGTVLFFYCMGGAWMLLLAGYPVHRLVGADEFAPFHRAFGRRLIAAFVVPGLLAYGLSFGVVYYLFVEAEPYGVSPVLALTAAGCSLVNIAVTLFFVLPKRRTLAREGKSEREIRKIEWAHLVRTLAWTAGSFAMLWMVVQAIGIL